LLRKTHKNQLQRVTNSFHLAVLQLRIQERLVGLNSHDRTDKTFSTLIQPTLNTFAISCYKQQKHKSTGMPLLATNGLFLYIR